MYDTKDTLGITAQLLRKFKFK